MVARISTVAFHGVEVRDVDAQVQIAGGLPTFSVVGLADKAVSEARERVRSALHALGLALPPKRITVNLAPADLAKEGSHYDLPIALGLLAAMDVISPADIDGYVVLGELALDGRIAPVAGVLPSAIHATSNGQGLICPGAQGAEAGWAGDINVLAADGLLALINHFKGTQQISPPPAPATTSAPVYPDLTDIKGQESAKRAVEIAAAGGHNLLMVGPPGAGKSMLAARMPGLLPPMTPEEILEVSMVHSLAGALPDGGLQAHRPFRDPHHSASMPALVGGGHRTRPGEVSLAHLGVLFLDELPEFQRPALEALRQPLETGAVTISRVNNRIRYPARFQLVAAMNPCRCGYLDDAGQACSRAPRCGRDYQSRISGPLYDRIDLCMEVPAVTVADLSLSAPREHSADIAVRVAAARAIQQTRLHEHAGAGGPNPASARVWAEGGRCNAHADGVFLEAIAAPDEAGRRLLGDAAEHFRLSARGYHRVLRVARTLADLDGGGGVRRLHIAEALSYRRHQPGT